MSTAVRKETLHKYISMGRKSDLKVGIPVTSIDTSIDSISRASLNLDRQLSVEKLSSYLSAGVELSVQFQRTTYFHLFLGPIFMVLILDLNNMFLEVLNTSQIYQNTSKVRFVKELANYTKYVLNNCLFDNMFWVDEITISAKKITLVDYKQQIVFLIDPINHS